MKESKFMSEKIILGIQNKDGSILGACQEPNGPFRLSVLNEKFHTVESAQMLINEGAWDKMLSPMELKEFENWFDEFYKTLPDFAPCYTCVDICGIKLLKQECQRGKKALIYKDLNELLKQHFSVLCLFNPSNNTWSVVERRSCYNCKNHRRGIIHHHKCALGGDHIDNIALYNGFCSSWNERKPWYHHLFKKHKE